MTYSNESFEHFQEKLENAKGSDPLLWELRDSLFAEVFYGKERRIDILNRLPGGWMLSLAFQYFQNRLKAVSNRLPEPNSGQSHFLFLSTRNNHINRLLPLYTKHRSSADCRAWYTMEGVPAETNDAGNPQILRIVGEWSRHLRVGDLFFAAKLSKQIWAVFPRELTPIQVSKIRIYLVQFMAWKRFWDQALGEQPQMIATTFEKSPQAKAFFYSARDKQTPRRIHWIHGLRHASIQSTLATELWCMTPGDVRYFETRIPDYCTATLKRNPEADELAEKIGYFNPHQIQKRGHIRFLFLGPGKEASYTREMRMADLAIIRAIQEELGALVEWRFRPHPSARERFQAELDEADIRIPDFSGRDLNDDLKWADAVGSSWSSLLLDVRETGRPIFWIQSEIRNLGAVDELIADGIGTHLNMSNAAYQIKALT